MENRFEFEFGFFHGGYYWTTVDGQTFARHIINCPQSAQFGGSCSCNSHDAVEFIERQTGTAELCRACLAAIERPELLGAVVAGCRNKIRRAIEDRLRKDARFLDAVIELHHNS